LEIIDLKVGTILEGVFTLVPRTKGICLTCKKRNNYEAFESLRRSGRVKNSRGNARTPTPESPNKPPYITVSHYARRAAPGTADSMKNITSETHEEITRLFCVLERLSLQHIPFDEVQGLWAAKNRGVWKAFPTAKDMDQRTDVFASMSSGLNAFPLFTRIWIFFTLPPQLSIGAYQKWMIIFSTTFVFQNKGCVLH
jgi:hypothetical protein